MSRVGAGPGASLPGDGGLHRSAADNPHAHGYADSGPRPNGNCDSRACAHADGNGICHPNGDALSLADIYACADTISNANADTISNANRYANSYGDSCSDCHLHTGAGNRG